MINNISPTRSSVPFREAGIERDPVRAIAREALAPSPPLVRLNLKNYRWYHIAAAAVGTALIVLGAFPIGLMMLSLAVIDFQRLKNNNARWQRNAESVAKINHYRARLEPFILLLRQENENPIEKARQVLEAYRLVGEIDSSLSGFPLPNP